MDSLRKRVEQKGRFTITEFIPGSPNSSRLSSPTFQDDKVVNPEVTESVSTDSCSDIVTIQLQPETLEQQVVSTLYSKDVMIKTEDLPENHTPVLEAVAVPIEVSLAIPPDTTDCSPEKVTTSTGVSIAAAPDPIRKLPSPKKNRDGPQRSRRVKRRGRFTIIELASESPTSRQNADDLYDHRFVTTTSIGGSSVPQPGNQLSGNLDNMERRPKPKRATRCTPRIRSPAFTRRSRRRSESPIRKVVEAVDSVGNQSQQSSCYVKPEVVPDTSPVVDYAGANAVATDAEVMSIQARKTNESVDNPSSITMSATEFLQQQQTIASLIRQQHDLKQIILVLQEQQQQLMAIPSQINELNHQRASGVYDVRDKEIRDLNIKVDKLTRANESLHLLINAADREARHRTLEIECLSEENDELRHRCGQLESRYMDERKQSFVLEEKLQSLRLLSLAHQGQQLRQQQQTKS